MNLLEHSKVKSKATLGDRSFTVAAPMVAMMFELHEVECMILSKIEKSANFDTFMTLSADCCDINMGYLLMTRYL
jgi:hypothetical protein